MPETSAPVLPGTLDMLVLKVVSVRPEHGWGIGQRLREASGGAFDVNQGSLYPAVQRLMKKGWVKSEWRDSEHGRRARYYRITRSGAAQLGRERASWSRQVEAVSRVLEWAY
jgi:PadR family transcriptional regulator, regulatory protein PadR